MARRWLFQKLSFEEIFIWMMLTGLNACRMMRVLRSLQDMVRNVDSPSVETPLFASMLVQPQPQAEEGRKFNFSMYVFDSLVRNVDSSTKFYMVGKGFCKVDTPLFEGMILAQQDNDVATEGAASVAVDDVPVVVDEPSIPSPTSTTQPPPPSQDLPSTSKQVGEDAKEVNVDDVLAAGIADKGVASVNDDDVPAAVNEPSISSPTPSTQPPPTSQDIPSTSQVYPTPPPSSIAQPPSPQQQPQSSQNARISIDLLQNLVKKLKRMNKLKASRLRRLKKVGTAPKVEKSNDTIMDDVSKQGRMINDMDADVDVTLKDIAKDVVVDAKTEESADVQGKQAESQAQIYQIDLKHADKVLSMQDDKVEPAELQEVV
uniref:Uncharacterized protein n=1 Tax=Tanacetum cinerariifolium TaxID=118510 RepID=A0A699IS39_TANCI|nr:hypothetical protein [Tanacetum cinerariifolium]